MRLVSLAIAICVVLSVAAVPCYASESFPSQPLRPPSTPAQGQSPEVRDRMYYGYVPPAPIRHTWPGGYKVIFHEIFNTLAEHILGNY